MSCRVVGPLAAAVLLLAVPRAEAQRVDLLIPLAELEARAQRDSLDPAAQYDAALGCMRSTPAPRTPACSMISATPWRARATFPRPRKC